MTTINLHQDQQDVQKKFSLRAMGGGFVFSLGILIVTLLVFAGLRIYVLVVEKQNLVLDNTVKSEQAGLVGYGSIGNILDMQTRLQQIRNNLQINDGRVQNLVMTDILDKLGSDLNADVVVSSYDYDSANKKVTVMFNASNFNDASRQILNFKKSKYFTNVNLTKINRGEKAIECEVEMSIGI